MIWTMAKQSVNVAENNLKKRLTTDCFVMIASNRKYSGKSMTAGTNTDILKNRKERLYVLNAKKFFSQMFEARLSIAMTV